MSRDEMYGPPNVEPKPLPGRINVMIIQGLLNDPNRIGRLRSKLSGQQAAAIDRLLDQYCEKDSRGRWCWPLTMAAGKAFGTGLAGLSEAYLPIGANGRLDLD